MDHLCLCPVHAFVVKNKNIKKLVSREGHDFQRNTQRAAHTAPPTCPVFVLFCFVFGGAVAYRERGCGGRRRPYAIIPSRREAFGIHSLIILVSLCCTIPIVLKGA